MAPVTFFSPSGDCPLFFPERSQFAAPSWKNGIGKGPAYLVQGISWNKQQFKNFKMEILYESETTIKARIKGFGENIIRDWNDPGVAVDDYIQFFEKKWIAIADYLGLEYKQKVKGGWIIFTVKKL